jgi:septal ring factor EnvC (AmiA/AmiB activator)
MNAEHPEPVPVRLVALSVVCLELPQTTPDELAAQLADELIIADDLGRRAVPASVARELIEAAEQARYDATEGARKRRAALQEHIAARNRARPVPKGVRLDLPEGMLPAAVLTATDPQPQYDGATYRPVPGHLDWQFGNAEGGGTFGPSRTAMRDAAKKKAAEKKGAGK